MKRVLTTVLAVALLLGLGALAVLAMPSANAPLAAAPVVSAAAPEAPAVTNKVNVIAMPLNATDQFAGNFTADGLATVVGSGVQQVLTWTTTAGGGGYKTWYPIDGEGDNFNLVVGGVYRLVLDPDAPSIVSFVGDVPEIGDVAFSLTRPAGTGCLINDISLPLHRSDIQKADQLATSIGNVSQVLEWNSSTPGYKTWYPQDGEGDNFDVKIGYPYRVCLLTGGVTNWP